MMMHADGWHMHQLDDDIDQDKAHVAELCHRNGMKLGASCVPSTCTMIHQQQPLARWIPPTTETIGSSISSIHHAARRQMAYASVG